MIIHTKPMKHVVPFYTFDQGFIQNETRIN